MSEHEHQWEFYPESDEIIFGLCMFPGCHEKKHIPLQKTMYTTIARYRLAELEQQLAQAQAAVIEWQHRATLAEEQIDSIDLDIKAENARLQELIERLRARDALLVEAEAKAVTLYAQARALLERYQKSGSLPTYAEHRQLFVDTEAFLANGGDDGSK